MSFFKKLFGGKDKAPEQLEFANGKDLEPYQNMPWMTELRLENIMACLDAGFRPASSLPTDLERELRPTIEIAKRLNAIKALVLWFMVPEDQLESAPILQFMDDNGLREYMDEGEIEMLKAARDDEEARNSIGWKFENAWPLAWYFGYEEPDIMGQMMEGEQMQEILHDFTCPLDEKIEDWIVDRETLPEDELMQMEDLFYCLHNAVRSAQIGGKTVPNGFHPVLNGGVIHERRHALTWMVSKGISWDDTDLST